ncbi:L-aminoadipate-semialdehyde dehydrogenase [Smittium mucronatum]|uniref:Alpha-aminoadipate reductase n=1 Tax=Smittium mucronatum TaxID=133383 RepID=A0A1R0GT45_9FUNG|nr:L-aminoadipate-semialdehyde dehydrogenase [Smittium mucronatum]
MTVQTSYVSDKEKEISRRLDYLCKTLDSPNEVLLPTDYPRPVPLKVVEAFEEFVLPPNLSMGVMQLVLASNQKSFQSQLNSSEDAPQLIVSNPFNIILSAFAIILYRFTASDDIVVGSSSESSDAVVLRLKIQPEMAFSEVLEMVKKVDFDANQNQVPFDKLIEAIAEQLISSGRVSKQDSKVAALYSLFRIRFFNMNDTNDTILHQTISESTDLTVFISQESTTSLRQSVPSIRVRFVYNQVLFSSKRIINLWEQLQNVLSVGINSTISHNLTSDELLSSKVGSISLLSSSGRAVLPDPKSDLHWSQFPGSITEIFAKNSIAHPDRVFCSESSLTFNDSINSSVSGSETVKFTYGQMFNSSRVVSRYLRTNGVERGDVVVIYAYRGVDLVVAIMGVLMAGATFSVIDPAYPPARQNIYLSVAKPKAVVVLSKAGDLHEEVDNYIVTNLKVSCKLSGIYIDFDGILQSDSVDLSQAKDLVSNSSDVMEDVVEVGIDSIGTLSFTSGSTGIPKGVQGRHYSLTHFYPWMQQTFGIGPSDKFTMLSGIAHDPIQRDIFTPIFFGAELHIPTSEDIGIPGQLAQWMEKTNVTVTHLTPAMGQLLSSNVTNQVSSLKNAFFVGDLLTRRDCTRIQSLAPNCQIINMYGTTETQRAVSYYSIPPLSLNPAFLSSMKEIIPAGKGMVDVQLLVVNVNNTKNVCGVGEVGEIYVRSGGLAEGYLRLEEATKEKFVYNWFVSASEQDNNVDRSEGLKYYLGPRDRLYRTGDLGRYTPDGHVECIGRIDDQVKIRGFRIELGEINNILSLYPQLVSSVVLVRRDKNEEKTLVAYIVPDEKEQKRTDDPSREMLIGKIRNYLKQKLPSYSIPSVFVPMKKLPLTPNGKIDKAALPFPDVPLFRKFSSGESSDPNKVIPTLSHLRPTAQALAKIWMDLLNLPTNTKFSNHSNFFDLGGHSILATRMVFRIRKELVADAPLGLVYKFPALGNLSSAIDDMKSDFKLSTSPEGNGSGSSSPSLGGSTVNQSRSSSKVNLDSFYDNSYSADLESLMKFVPELSSTLEARTSLPPSPTFLLTGATGFLGAYILSKTLEKYPNSIVYCLTRARDSKSAMNRLRDASEANLLWKNSWEENGQVRPLVGDLSQDMLGLDQVTWDRMCSEVDAVIHNGALVNWVWPYEKLRAPNVLGTIEALKIASEHHLKPLVFVSSTSVLDSPYYVQAGENRQAGVSEDDDLEGNRTGLRSGYGQSKWVSEKLIFHARSLGFPVSIIRPGYVVGDSTTGVTNTDDFIWRLVKGCIELKKIPAMNNVVNLCPVDYVAQVALEAALSFYPEGSSSPPNHLVYQVFNKQNFRFMDLFNSMSSYGYELEKTEYIDWRDSLLNYTVASSEDSALFPLLHFVLDDLPTSTRAPKLDNANTEALMSSVGVSCPRIIDLIGLYLAYLVKADFIPPPENLGQTQLVLPTIDYEVGAVLSRHNN